jgi:hypothetical protein
MERRYAVLVLLVCTVMLSPYIVILPSDAAGNAVLSFSPAQSLVSFPQPVTVNVTLNSVVNLNSWQIKVVFNSSVLVYSSMTIPSDNLLGPSGGWFQFQGSNGTGYLMVMLSLDPGQVVSGSGTLCQISFNVTQSGMSPLTFASLGVPGPTGGTALLADSGNLIPFDPLNGNVQASSGPIANFALIPLKPSVNRTAIFDASSSQVGWSSSIPGYAPITSYIWNFGDGTPANTTSNSTIQHVFALVGNYTVALTVKDSVLRTNSTSRLVQVINRTLWDLDGDGKVTDMKDIAIVAMAFGSTPESPNWNPIADNTGPILLVPDGKVDMRDVALVARHFGQPE